MNYTEKVSLGKGYDEDGYDRVCIAREYFDARQIPCEKCGIRKFCWDRVSENAVEEIVEYIRNTRGIREFWEDFEEELYD